MTEENNFPCKIDSHGNVKINIYDLIENMSEDDINAVIEAFSWNAPVYKKVIENLRNTYAGKNYNDDIYQLRKLFFTMPVNEEFEYLEDSPLGDIIRIMTDTMREILKENAELNIKLNKHYEAKAKLMEYLYSLGWNNERVYEANQVYSRAIYPKNEEEKSYILARKMSEMMKIDEFIANWCGKMYNLFNKKDDLSNENIQEN